MKKKALQRRILTSLLAAALLTAVCGTGCLYAADNYVSDRLYQHAAPTSRDIVVFGIDQETLDVLGPASSLRGAMAQVIETLDADPADAPAVIGIDVMYNGKNADAPEADARLAQAAARYDNIVLAADAAFGSEAVLCDNGAYALRERSVVGWYEPYEELRAAAETGHVNFNADPDGPIRHARLYLDVPENGRVYSFARVIYEKWCEERGETPGELPRTSAYGYYYIPFTTAARDGYADGYSFLDLYRGEVDPYYYRDRIVLIGSVAPGLSDDHRTALDRSAETPGVVIQANVIQAFQNGFFPREAGRTVQLCLLFVVCILLALFFHDRHALPAAAVWLAVCAAWTALCALAYRRGVILHVLWVPVAATVLFVGSVAANFLRARREKRFVTDTFGHYIDPAIMQQLLSRGPEALGLGGTARHVAVLFVDVRGFTAMSETLDAQTVVEIVNRYLTLTTACIMDNHGTLDKFVGDCTMAVWNAPLEQEDPVYLACRAAMDMLERSAALGEELMRLYGRSVSFGIGIDWGPAVVGNIGAPKRLDYTAIGDTVNTASRLEANAPAGSVLISRSVADALGGRAEVVSLGNSVKLKGKSPDFEVLELKALR